MVKEGFKCFVHFSQTSLLKLERFFFNLKPYDFFFSPNSSLDCRDVANCQC